VSCTAWPRLIRARWTGPRRRGMGLRRRFPVSHEGRGKGIGL
jgi:hypothetical protein